MKKHDQNGFAHLGALVLVAGIVSVTGFAGYTVYKSNAEASQTSKSQKSEKAELALPAGLDDVLAVDRVKEIAAGTGGTTVTGLELKNKDGSLVYEARLSDGSVVLIDAKTGEKIRTLTGETDPGDDDQLPAGVSPTLTFEAARAIAQKQFPNSKIEKIQLEVQDGKVVYSVRFLDDARVDVNAADGSIVRTRQPKSGAVQTQGSATTSSTPVSSDDSSGSSGSGSDDSSGGDNDSSGNDSPSDLNDDSGSGDDDSSNSGSGSSDDDRR